MNSVGNITSFGEQTVEVKKLSETLAIFTVLCIGRTVSASQHFILLAGSTATTEPYAIRVNAFTDIGILSDFDLGLAWESFSAGGPLRAVQGGSCMGDITDDSNSIPTAPCTNPVVYHHRPNISRTGIPGGCGPTDKIYIRQTRGGTSPSICSQFYRSTHTLIVPQAAIIDWNKQSTDNLGGGSMDVTKVQ